MSVPTNDKPSGDGLPEKRLWGVRAELAFRRTLADAMKRSGKSRMQIAHEMSESLGRAIGKNILDDCVRSRKKGRMTRFPAAWVAALCEVLGSDQLAVAVMPQRLRELAELGHRVDEAKSLFRTITTQIDALARRRCSRRP
jgi:hypothetical protein